MSSAVQTIDEVSRLLGALPGVTVLTGRLDGGTAIFDLIIRGADSAHLVQRLCEAANVALEPPVRLHYPELGAGHFSLSASIQGFDTIELGYLQLLGIHLVWHLHPTDSMPAGMVADQLLQQWKGARVGA